MLGWDFTSLFAGSWKNVASGKNTSLGDAPHWGRSPWERCVETALIGNGGWEV